MQPLRVLSACALLSVEIGVSLPFPACSDGHVRVLTAQLCPEMGFLHFCLGMGAMQTNTYTLRMSPALVAVKMSCVMAGHKPWSQQQRKRFVPSHT
jgi:hypothetical protein